MQPPQILVLFLPVAVTALAGWLSHAGLPKWANAIIALFVVLASATIWALISQQLVGDLVADIVLIASYSAALMAGPLLPLYQWITVTVPSPLSIFAPPAPFIAPITTQPTAPIAARASTLSSGQTWRPVTTLSGSETPAQAAETARAEQTPPPPGEPRG